MKCTKAKEYKTRTRAGYQFKIKQTQYVGVGILHNKDHYGMFPHALKKATGPNSVYAYVILQALLFNRVVDDLNSWMDEVENHLMSEDHGKDLTSVNSLLKKHQVGMLHVTVTLSVHKQNPRSCLHRFWRVHQHELIQLFEHMLHANLLNYLSMCCVFQQLVLDILSQLCECVVCFSSWC